MPAGKLRFSHSLRAQLCLAFLTIVVALTARASNPNHAGNQFFGYENFSAFTKSTNHTSTEIVLLSPEIASAIQWKELILSWNARASDASFLKLEARALYPDHLTKFYTMGLWSKNPTNHARESVRRQKDADGNVSTDTLILTKPAERFQIRVTLDGPANELPALKFLGVSLTDVDTSIPAEAPNPQAWGKLIPVPERSQMVYPNGNVLCSPTTVSMILSYWSQHLNRADLNKDVPEVAGQVYDFKWDGAGNWVFNTAYAGSFPGIRAYVTRFSDVSELEDWIAADLPVGVSLCYNKLRGKPGPPSGHLVVCVGFNNDGDVILNDPGTTRNVRKTFPRKQFIEAWKNSKNAVYLIYPEEAKVPKDRFGHWHSP